MNKTPIFPLCILLLFGFWAYGNEPVLVQKLSPEFVFDGMVGEGEWDHIAPLSITVQTPVYHSSPSERTEIRIAYDENYIYLSGAMYDSEAHKIQANNKERDGGDASTEWFGMVIDSYHDKQNGLGFFTTPTGSRFDAAISNDADGRNPMNMNWNNFWDVKTVLNEDGWFAEIRVPFSSLQFQEIDGKVTMGITSWRYIARKNELHICPDISPELGEMGMWRPSQANTYVFEKVPPRKPFYITPYALAGRSMVNELNDEETSYTSDKNWIKEAGLDVKYGISNNFILDLSVNTDFAQVEVDDQQVNLTRFSLFFPEKRLFFQERSGIFDFTAGGNNNLFYSRRIGIDDDGNTIPILGGARLTGRSGDWDIGLISMQTQNTDDFASNNYSVFRVKKRVINDNSSVGFLFTNNFDVDGYRNTIYGFDSYVRFFKDHFVGLKFAQAFSSDVKSTAFSTDPSLFWIRFNRRSEKGFTYGTSLSRLGKDFNSRMGFIQREDYTRLGARLQYNWFPTSASKLFRHGAKIAGLSHWDNSTNLYNSASYEISYNWQWKNGSRIEAGTRIQYDDILEAFELEEVAIVPVDDYFYQSYELEMSTSSSRPYILVTGLSTGDFYDGKKTTLSFTPNVNVSSSFRLSAVYEFNKINFDSRNQEFTAHIARLKGLLMLSTKFSISSFVQYNSLDKRYLANIRIRYNPREGNDLFIVLNSDLNEDRELSNPILPVHNQQSVLLKYSYTFSL